MVACREAQLGPQGTVLAGVASCLSAELHRWGGFELRSTSARRRWAPLGPPPRATLSGPLSPFESDPSGSVPLRSLRAENRSPAVATGNGPIRRDHRACVSWSSMPTTPGMALRRGPAQARQRGWGNGGRTRLAGGRRFRSRLASPRTTKNGPGVCRAHLERTDAVHLRGRTRRPRRGRCRWCTDGRWSRAAPWRSRCRP
jgi:hypothetical protein